MWCARREVRPLECPSRFRPSLRPSRGPIHRWNILGDAARWVEGVRAVEWIMPDGNGHTVGRVFVDGGEGVGCAAVMGSALMRYPLEIAGRVFANRGGRVGCAVMLGPR